VGETALERRSTGLGSNSLRCIRAQPRARSANDAAGTESALLSTRLADAAAAGCKVGVITTQPASKSQQNAQRSGFDLLYTRVVLVKRP